jgi:hypothetical protein
MNKRQRRERERFQHAVETWTIIRVLQTCGWLKERTNDERTSPTAPRPAGRHT